MDDDIDDLSILWIMGIFGECEYLILWTTINLAYLILRITVNTLYLEFVVCDDYVENLVGDI